MIELNWNIFKSKFNGKERGSFEDLSYQLFCAENNNRIGIFRFKNQTGVETEPTQVNGEFIGFQSKYYDTRLADNKDDIIDSLKKAKRENPNLNRLLIYVNQEFSESSTLEKKDPAYKTDIESEAIKVNVSIDWRVPSHFERQLALPENKYLAEYFFSNGHTILEFIDGLKKHSENLFLSIQTDILFKEKSIKINRNKIVETLATAINNAGSKTLIVSGEGGSGKTALIKEYYQTKGSEIPFYVFKAVEFNIPATGSLFKSYGDYSLADFISAHEKEERKVIVIDSAERISDLENQEPFKELLATLLTSSWTIVFTTRLSYLDDLRFQLLSVYRLPFEHVNISNLSVPELDILSKEHSFELPLHERVKSLIQNLFYLDEYLRNYDGYNRTVQYRQFKNTIWLRKIQNSIFTKANIHIQREKCFLNICQIRSSEGSFFISPTNCSEESLSLLVKDEIIAYDNNAGRYFITHDIYEEWGLEMFIERLFISSTKYAEFINQIGSSLLARRAFRQWLSDKLFDSVEQIKPFVEEMYSTQEIEPFWRDEIITSVLLSDYSGEFFTRFRDKIIENEFVLLKKIIFLLRVSCKSIDDTFAKATKKQEDLNLNYVFTKPKGTGWKKAVQFVNDHKELFDLSTIDFIVPLLTDWCGKNKRGKTTRAAGLFALRFYEDIQTAKEHKYRHEKNSEQLVEIIILSSNEIKEELNQIFSTVFGREELNNQTPYYGLCKKVISSDFDNLSIIIALPEQVLKLAELFWLEPKNTPDHYSRGYGPEKHYGLNEYGGDRYFPASAYQTPIYWLLKFALQRTIDFVIQFTSTTVKIYSESEYDKNVMQIEIVAGKNEVKKQYLSQGLWNMYRGTSSPVSPYLLQSIHMALEKYLLEIAKDADVETVESWLIYLIKNSNSASITAVVASVVLAYPAKFFNVAKILFSSSYLILFDRLRARMHESQTRGLYSIGAGMDYRNKLFVDERLKTCDDKHRNLSLEDLIIQYQFFAEEGTPEEVTRQRQEDIWEIIDALHSKLPDKSTESDSDKTIRLLLASIDRRTMSPKVEAKENSVHIEFNPQIAPELEAHSKEAIKASYERMKYVGLKLWSIYKFDISRKYGDYPQYENDPALVLTETREIVLEMKNNNVSYDYYLFNHSIPAFSCSALLREYSHALTQEEREFCGEIIMEFSTSHFRPDYDYQISDGVEVAVNALPYLIESVPEKSSECLIVLLLTLFDATPIGEYKRVCDYSIESIQRRLLTHKPVEAKKVVIAFLRFRPLFRSIIKSFDSKRIAWSGYPQHELIEKFTRDNETLIEEFFTRPNEHINFDPREYELDDLEILFQLIPHDTVDQQLVELATTTLPLFGQRLLKKDKDIDYLLRIRIFKRTILFILFRESKDVQSCVKPFVDNFSVSEEMTLFFEEFISAEDRVQQYEQFWIVWNSFYDKIKESISCAKDYRFSGQIHAYLLAWRWWKETADSWHSLKESEIIFYKRVVKDIGSNASVFDSIAKFLNEIGSGFLNEGVNWISQMVKDQNRADLEVNTVHYIEKLMRKYVHLNRFNIRQDVKLKNRVLIILDFLVEQSSVSAYLMREDIL